MGEKTAIAWCDSTWNPWIGCTKVGPGCDHCYAEALDKRHRWGGATHWGAGVERKRTSEAYWRQPLTWNRKAAESGKPWRVFCASLADVFDNEVPEQWRWDLWDLIAETPALTWLLLTKRIGNAAKMLPWAYPGKPWPNVWLGASVVNKEEAARDVPKLYATPAARRFVSYEPAIEEVDFNEYLEHWRCRTCGTRGNRYTLTTRKGSLECPRCLHKHAICGQLEWCGIDQLIVGGESRQGPHKPRPFVIGWARAGLRACRNSAGTAFFMKQFGANATNREGLRHPFKDRAGADPAEWPEDLRVQEFPSA